MNYLFKPPLDSILLAQLSKKLCRLCHYALALTEPNKELNPVRYAVPNSANPDAFIIAYPSKPTEAGLCYLCSKKQAGLFNRIYPKGAKPRPQNLNQFI